ncbi:MAG: hypothetical protein RR735_08600 [Bacteroidales bacterium]
MKICDRIYSNFFRKSRYKLYDAMLKSAIERGYQFYTIKEFNSLLKQEGLNPRTKYAIIRHDVDTDPLTAYKLFLIENKYNIASTYYFRLNTINDKLIKKMLVEGNVEIAYHYEEIATYAKKHKIKSISEIENDIEVIREIFLDNLKIFRQRLGVASETVASHGDFVNKYLGLLNLYLINNTVRKKGGIELEAYDPFFMDNVTCRIADLGNIDGIWTPQGFYQSLEKEEPVLYILVHPRQWYSRILSNCKADYIRGKEEILYRL